MEMAVLEDRVARSVLGLMRWANRTDVRRQVWTLQEAPLSPSDLSLLVAIADQGPVRATDLAASLGVDKSTISPQVRRLERLGLVVRTRAEEDRRAALLTPSPLGRSTAERLQQAASELLAGRLAHWSGRDRQLLAGLLERLVRDLDAGRAG